MAANPAGANRYRKPKKPPKTQTYGTVTGSAPALNVTSPKPISAPRPSTGSNVAPAQSTYRPPAAYGTFKPPETTHAAETRSTAESTYQAALRTGRQSIVDAALRLGSPEIINALKADPNFAEYVAILDKGSSDPSSQLNLAAQDEKEGLQGVDVNANAGNTFFSGKRQKDRQDLSDDFTAARAGYLRDYTTGYNTLIGNMGLAKGDYEHTLKDADWEDYNAWLAQQPKPTGPDTGASTPTGIPEGFARMPQAPGATGPAKGIFSTTPKAGFGFVQTEGSRAGLSYNVKVVNGVKYRIYENGDKVKVG